MTSYLAPESPRPFCVASEHYFRQIDPSTGFNIQQNNRTYPITRCLFGEQYEKEFSFYLAKHAEVNCNDHVCLIGDDPNWITILQERLFLNKAVHFIDIKLQQGRDFMRSSCLVDIVDLHSKAKQKMNMNDLCSKSTDQKRVRFLILVYLII
jgi:hypothetical protein